MLEAQKAKPTSWTWTLAAQQNARKKKRLIGRGSPQTRLPSQVGSSRCAVCRMSMTTWYEELNEVPQMWLLFSKKKPWADLIDIEYIRISRQSQWGSLCPPCTHSCIPLLPYTIKIVEIVYVLINSCFINSELTLHTQCLTYSRKNRVIKLVILIICYEWPQPTFSINFINYVK